MGKRKRIISIPPFPAEIDRDYFGAWLSGFADGEACFYLGLARRNGKSAMPDAGFHLGLRFDEQPVLKLIRAYWQCGQIRHYIVAKNKPHWHPTSRFSIDATDSLRDIVIPHFHKYLYWRKNRKTLQFGRKPCYLCGASSLVVVERCEVGLAVLFTGLRATSLNFSNSCRRSD